MQEMPIALSLSHQVLWPCVDVVEHQVTYMQLRKLIHDVYIELLSQGKLFSSEKQYFVGALQVYLSGIIMKEP